MSAVKSCLNLKALQGFQNSSFLWCWRLQRNHSRPLRQRLSETLRKLSPNHCSIRPHYQDSLQHCQLFGLHHMVFKWLSYVHWVHLLSAEFHFDTSILLPVRIHCKYIYEHYPQQCPVRAVNKGYVILVNCTKEDTAKHR